MYQNVAQILEQWLANWLIGLQIAIPQWRQHALHCGWVPGGVWLPDVRELTSYCSFRLPPRTFYLSCYVFKPTRSCYHVLLLQHFTKIVLFRMRSFFLIPTTQFARDIVPSTPRMFFWSIWSCSTGVLLPPAANLCTVQLAVPLIFYTWRWILHRQQIEPYFIYM